MYVLPLNLLVENFCRCENVPMPQAMVEGHFELPLGLQHRFGVLADEQEGELLFFAHPGEDPQEHCRDDAFREEHEESFEDLAIGSDECGPWWLRIDDTHAPKHTLWIRVPHPGIGHAEFARVVAGMRSRFDIWTEVLAAA
ncbi:hypothetical protein [Variovorax sp. DT-64]|uniref:hypothetical protein n=1 Tax=Variovorax sp. DT-64 TaxID=3396160 RepID=UPI003F1C933E